MRVEIKKTSLSGSVLAPPSKSMAHRMLICGGLSEGTSTVRGIAPSEDVMATLDCLSAIGASYTYDGDVVTITGADFKDSGDFLLKCRESGSTLRFFMPICLATKNHAMFYGTRKLLSRPLDVYEKIFNTQGIDYKKSDDSIELFGRLSSGNYKIPGNISSQFISGLLFVLPLLSGDSIIDIVPPIESCSYIKLTIQALREFGVEVLWKDERTLYIRGGQKYTPRDVTVEGDYSNAAFFEALNYLGDDVRVLGLNPESIQGDRVYKGFFDMMLKGTPTIHISDCPDLGPVLFAVCAAHNGGVFTGTKRLKIKESDRGWAMAQELRKFGVSVKVEEDTIVVYPAEFHAPDEVLYGHNDHRIVMSLAILLSKTGGAVSGAEAVKKSMPDFFVKLRELGLEAEEYEE